MAINTDKNSYTVIFAVLMVVVVGSLLAFVASGLKPKIDENERFEKQQNILYAMGVKLTTRLVTFFMMQLSSVCSKFKLK